MHGDDKYFIKGSVVNLKGLAIPNLTIEAWDKDLLIDDYLGSAISDQQGRFSIIFDSDRFREWFFDRRPDVFFRIYHQGDLVHDSRDDVICNVADKLAVEIKIDWEHDQAPAGLINKTVYGKVSLGNGLPAVGMDVKVYNKSLRVDSLLAETTTDNQGQYKMTYPAHAVNNIILRAFNAGSDDAVTTSNVVLQAGKNEEVHLSIEQNSYRGLSLYETIERDIALHIGDTTISDLDTEELALLASESGLAKEHLTLYQQAQKRSSESLSSVILFALAYNKIDIRKSNIANLSTDKIRHYVAKSLEERIIPDHLVPDLDKQLAAHDKQRVKHQLSHSAFASQIPLKDIWSLAGPSEEQLDTLGASLIDANNVPSAFWETLSDNDSIKPLLPRLELLTQLNNLTFGNLALINKLSDDKSIDSLADLAGQPAEAWLALLGDQTIPEEIQGEPEERANIYATGMKRMVDYLYPTKNIFTSIAADNKLNDSLKSDFSVFYQNNPDFDIEQVDLDKMLASSPDSLDGISDKDRFKRELDTVVRLTYLTPAVDQYLNISILQQLNLGSASDIVKQSRSGFLEYFRQHGGNENDAGLIHATALAVTAITQMWYASAQIDTQISCYVLDTGIRQTPEWREHFGTEDFCNCQHCKSVYSPAAYLTDCLHFLEQRKLTQVISSKDGAPSVYNVLDERRPDIKNILLNCENANTAMPYIDLVNEVLEIAALKKGDFQFLSLEKNQSTRTTDQLLATPEHIKEDAYEKILKNSTYPWSMPFDLYDQLGKTYLQHLGVNHHKLVSLFPVSDPSAGDEGNRTQNAIRKTRAILALNETDWDILLTHDYSSREEELWGIEKDESISDTSNIEFFMKKSQLSLDELRELVNSRFVNSDIQLNLQFPQPCNLEGATIEKLNTTTRKRILQLCRLQRKLQVDLRTVDHILTALASTTSDKFELTADTLGDIAQLVVWHQEYGTAYDELVTWVGVMPTAYPADDNHHQELYEKLFLASLEEGETTAHFQLIGDKTALEPNTIFLIELLDEDDVDNGKSKSVRNYILGALRITADQLIVALELLGKKKLTLVNLSKIYGYFSLARTLKVEIDELFHLKQVIEFTSTAKTRNILQIMDFVDQTRLAGLSVQQILLLFDKTEEGKLPSNRKIEILEEIREGIWKFNDQWKDKALEFLSDEDDEGKLATPLTAEYFIFEKLSTAFGIDRDNIIRLLEVPINDATNSAEPSLSYLVDISDELQKSYIELFLADEFVIPEPVEPDEGYDLKLMSVATTDDLLDAGRFLVIVALVGTDLHIRVFDASGEKVVDKAENELVGREEVKAFKQKITLLRNEVILSHRNRELDRLRDHEVILSQEDKQDIINTATEIAEHPLEEDWTILDSFPKINNLFDLLHKISLLFNSFEFQDRHYQTLISPAGKSFIDFNKLSDRSMPDDALVTGSLFEQFVELLKINEVIKETSKATINIFDLLFPGSHDEQDLEKLFDCKNIKVFRMTLGFTNGFTDEDYSNPDLYLNLLSVIVLERYLGIHIADYVDSNDQFSWAKSALQRKQVEEIVQVAKAKYGDKKWQTVTRQLRNDIREQQRDALLAYITANNTELDTPEKLYAFLLIDVEMNSRTITSRIKLALSSVQLFVQRCLMNLEPDINLQIISEDERLEWEEWSWRKNYRVWEANRKVFLYPENWLEPEWRDDKTEFFKELETELLQNELNDISAEKAYLNYLAKLESVNNLEIMAMCEAEKNSGYYIFGRTHGNPKVLYFRKFELDPESFTAWEKIDVDFEGEHLVPAIHNGRLHLFWPVFGEVSSKGKGKSSENDSYLESTKALTVQLAWSQFYNDKWGSRKVTEAIPLEPSVENKPKVAHKEYYYISYANEYITIYFRLDVTGSDTDIKEHVGYASWNFSGNNPELKLHELERFHFAPLRSDNELLKTINQRPVVGSIPSDGNIRLHNNILVNLELPFQHTSFITSPIPNPWEIYNLKSFIIQNRNLSILLKRPTQNHLIYSVTPLQAPLYSTFANGIFTYGLRSNHVYSGWKDYQNQAVEEIKITDEISLARQRVSNFSDIDTKNNLNRSKAFSQYTWELFFHIPMHIANKLRQDQKFEEAQQWFHYVFNPTSSDDGDTPEKFWLFQPFRDYVGSDEAGQPRNIQELMRILNEQEETPDFQTFENNVHAWERDPFSPHTVARNRIVAYMKWVVMRYIDNLIEWADQLFRRDSIESLNEATQLYMLAWNILGEEPRPVNEQDRDDQSYQQIRDDLDEFSNVMIEIEKKVTRRVFQYHNDRDSHRDESYNPRNISQQKEDTSDHNTVVQDNGKRGFSESRKLSTIHSNQPQDIFRNLYFCIPQNEKLLGYWGLVRDRFFKLRNSLNIEGVYRQLPLYEPPIDPALLIKARAAGLSIADALSAQYQPRSHYRFLALLQKAVDYANDVRGFGGALLSAMEKRDAERISFLRSMHEVQLLDEATFIRKEHINELKESSKALEYSQKNIESRRDYYAGKEFLNSKEMEQIRLQNVSNMHRGYSQTASLAAAFFQPMPKNTAGYSSLGGHFVTEFSGAQLANALNFTAQAFTAYANIKSMKAAKAGQMASYTRRFEDWKFQESTAETELKQIEKQILAAEIRMAIAKQELKNHNLQVDNSKKQLELVQTKFTNAELYDWMMGQLKTLYFQSYQMAFDMAKKAEFALDSELGIGVNETESFIKFGYWDKLKEGLLSGEKLHHDLKRMESIYMQRNKRKQEVTQTFSLAMVNSSELMTLRLEGKCAFTLNEILFDLANEHLTNRKVKSVSLTIPAVTGPYTGIHATLSNGSERITTSSAQNDSGVFQFNFNDERYLPFEGIDPCNSSWNINMNNTFKSFDYNTISDVLLHINYSADYDENKQLVLPEAGLDLTLYMSLKHDFSDEWQQFTNSDGHLNITINKQHLPFLANTMTTVITVLKLYHESALVKDISLTEPQALDTPIVIERNIIISNGNTPDNMYLVVNFQVNIEVDPIPDTVNQHL